MKRLVLIALLLTAWVVPAAAQDEKIDHRLLVERDGRMYLKFSDTPFTGATREKNRIHRKYKNGRLHGPKLEFYRNGQLKAKAIWQNGKLDGPFKNYYKNGKVESSGFYSDGAATGIWTLYYENGTKWAYRRYENDEPNGEHIEWYKNGRKRTEGKMKNGKETGYWTFYSKDDGRADGDLSGTYENGIKIK